MVNAQSVFSNMISSKTCPKWEDAKDLGNDEDANE
jgi:hypothetical protein